MARSIRSEAGGDPASEGDRDRAFAETQTVLKVYPNVKLIMAIAAPRFLAPLKLSTIRPNRCESFRLSLPNMSKPYVHSGVIDNIVLWNTLDLGT